MQRWTPVKNKHPAPTVTSPVDQPLAAPVSQTDHDPPASQANIQDDLIDEPAINPLQDVSDTCELGHSSDNDLPTEEPPLDIPTVPDDVVRRIHLIPPTPDTDILI